MKTFLVVVVVVVAVTSIWVVFDAARLEVRRGRLGGGLVDIGLVGWFVACELVWIVGFPLYLLARRRYVALRRRAGDSLAAVSSGAAPPAWYPDPTVQGRQRWWDGQSWTEHTL
jgi:hypothetical protein